MKFDKETLIKQKFWVALCSVVPLLLIIWLVLVFGVSGDVGTEKKNFDDATKAADGVAKSEQKNESFVEVLDKSRTVVTGKKDGVWKQAWEPQAQLMTWPRTLERLSSLYYGDPISEEDRRNYEKELYWEQYSAFKDMILPAEYEGGWENVLQYVGKGKQPGTFEKVPTTEECWLAQEDLWVQRELLRVVKDTIDSLAEFQPVADVKDVTPPAGTLNKQFRYRNANWEVDLFLKHDNEKNLVLSGDSTVKNINSNKRTLLLGRGKALGLLLRVKQGEVEAPVVQVQRNPLAYEKSTNFGEAWRMDNIDPNRPLQVVQVFDWYSSPVKRVDTVAMGKQGQRLANYPLVSKQIGPKEEEKKDEAPAGGAGGFGTGPGAPTMSGMTMGGKGGSGSAAGLGGAGAGLDLTPNGLERKRYLIPPTLQVRRMPVALVVVVDQAYVPDVLTAFANSKLRIQTIQEHWHHVQGIHQKMEESPGASGVGPTTAPGGTTSGMGSLRGGGGRGMPPTGSMGAASGGRGPKGAGFGAANPGSAGVRPGGGSTPPPAIGGFPGGGLRGGLGGSDSSLDGGDEDVPNLVELAVYGIASLYERFPAKPTSTGDGGLPK